MSSRRELDQIKSAAGSYRTYALQARRRMLKALAQTDGQIASAYLRMVRRVLDDYRAGGVQGTAGLLEAIARDYDANRLHTDIAAILDRAIEQGAAAGITFAQVVGEDALNRVGMSTEPLIRAMDFCRRDAVAAAYARTYSDGLHLSDRIWRTARESRDAMRAIVTAGVGEDAVTVARALEGYVKYGAKRTAASYPGMMRRMGSRVPANLDYNALRLARTELTAAYSESTIASAKACPTIKQVRWVLSGSHPRTDICDTYAAGGIGGGIYPANECPLSPAHPNCLCTIQPMPEDPVSAAKRLHKWLQDPSSQPDIERWYQRHYKQFEGDGPNLFAGSGKMADSRPTLANLRQRHKLTSSMAADEREATMQRAGKEIYDEVRKSPTLAARADKEHALLGKMRALETKYMRATNWRDEQAIKDEWRDLRANYSACRQDNIRANIKEMRALMSRVRSLEQDSTLIKAHLGRSRSVYKSQVIDGYRNYPAEWQAAAYKRGPLRLKKVDRGYYNDSGSEMGLSQSGAEADCTIIHELGHRMEFSVPGLRAAEAHFYARRTQGEAARWLGTGYSRREVTRADHFVHKYMGKDYGGDAYELVSMGVEMIYTDPMTLMADEDMATWILGLLALL